MEMKYTSSDYWKHFPILAVRDGVIISKRGDITVGWETRPPAIHSLDRDALEGIHRKTAEAVRLLSPWMLVHRQDVFTREPWHPRAGDGLFLEGCYLKHFSGRPFLRHRQYLFLTLASRSSALRPVTSSGLFGVPAGHAPVSAADVTRLLAEGEAFIRKLTENRLLTARALDDGELIGILEDYRRLYSRDRVPTDLELRPESVRLGQDILYSYTVSEAGDLSGIISSSLRHESFSRSQSGLYTSSGALVGPLLDCEHIVNSYILTTEPDRTMSEIDGRRRRMLSMSRRSVENRVNSEEIAQFQDRVHTDGLRPVLAHHNVMTWGPAEDAPKMNGAVLSALSSMGASITRNTFDTPVIFYSAMPGAGCEIGRENLMVTELEGAVALQTVEGFEESLPDGILPLCDRIRHIPVMTDMQSAAMKAGLIDNYNAFILGESGSGKSFFTNHLARCCYGSGESVFIIDMGDSYQGLCSVIREESGGRDGHYYTWDSDHPISFDAFRNIGEWTDASGRLNADSDGLNFILSFLQTMWTPQGGWTDGASNIIKSFLADFVVSASRTAEKPVFSDFRDFLKDSVLPRLGRAGDGYMCEGIPVTPARFDLEDMLLAMRDYCTEGPFGFLLNDRNPKDFMTSRFSVFEITRLSQIHDRKFFSLAVLCIMNAFSAKMRSTAGHKVIIIEEAWKAIANETMSSYLAGLWKTARKYQTSAVVVTQQISDIISSGIVRDTILQNSSVKVLLKQSGGTANMDEISSLMGLTEHERALVQSMNCSVPKGLRYKEVFLSLGGKKSAVYATEVSPQEAIAYESNKEQKAAFLELAARTGYIHAADTLAREGRG